MKKIIAIYPGRFQPFAMHHHKAFEWLCKQFGKSNCYIVTSNKTGENSPFTFDEKVQIMNQFGIKDSQIVNCKSPYSPKELLDQFNSEDYALVVMYGQKDAGRIKYTKSNGSPGYYSPYNSTNKDSMESFADKGYIVVAPHISIHSKAGELSGTNIRNYFDDMDPITFKSMYGWFNQDIFDMMKPKLKKKITEASATSGNSSVDDGPRFMYGNLKSYKSSLDNNSKSIGWQVLNWLLPEKDLENFDTEWPNGPIPTVSFFPTGVDGNQNAGTSYYRELSGTPAYKKWLDFISNSFGENEMIGTMKNIKESTYNRRKLSKSELASIEKYADKLFSIYDIDVDLSKKHFFKRVNDKRNGEPITADELRQLFRSVFKMHGEDISQMDARAEAVIKHMRNDLNLPFIIQWDDKNKEFDLIAKTILRKKNFKTPNKILSVESISENEIVIPKSLGIDRKDMPQIKNIPDFLKWISADEVDWMNVFIPIKDLQLVQKHINKDKVKSIIQDPDPSIIDNIIISKDNYILDGNHRAVAFLYMFPDRQLKVIKIDLGIIDLLKKCKRYPKVKFQNLNENLLLEGGGYGHLSHPFERMEFKFSDLEELISRSLEGNLKLEGDVTEKSDGKNIMVTFKDGEVKAARNKTTLKDPMDILSLKNKFSGTGELQNAFVEALKDIRASLLKLGSTKLDSIFLDGKRYLNVEIISSLSKNVIDYGDNSYLIFLGLIEFDENMKPLNNKIKEAHQLRNLIKSINADNQKTYSIINPNILDLVKHSDFDERLSYFKSKLKRIYSNLGLTSSSTIQDYYNEVISKLIDKKFPSLSSELRQGLINRWAKNDKSLRLNRKSMGPIFVEVKKYETTHLKTTLRKIKEPLEIIFLELGVEVLKNINTLLSVSPDKTIQSLRKQVQSTIQQAKNSKDPSLSKQVSDHLLKLSAIGGINSILPTEGIVFRFKGKLIKLTGAFAPVNQLIGIFKYKR